MKAEARRGSGGAVASGHYLATQAGLDVLREGGNAFDAAVCVGFCLNVLEPFLVGTGGEVPMLIRPAGSEVTAVSGQGCAPAALTLDWLESRGIERIPGDGFLPAVVPGALGAWCRLASQFGSLPWARLLEPAIELAEGFPLYPLLREQLTRHRSRLLTLYPSTAAVFLHGGEVPPLGARICNPALAAFYRQLVAAGGPDGAAALFYGGPLGRQLLAEAAQLPTEDATGAVRECLLTESDLVGWQPRFEAPAEGGYRGHTVFKCGPWTQGPVFLQQLALLQELPPFDESSVALHRTIECHKLAFADRELHYGDPEFGDVPLRELLSPAYSRERVALIDERASLAIRPGSAGGRGVSPIPWFPGPGGEGAGVPIGAGAAGPHAGWGPPSGDTTHLDVVDRHGNLVSATPSGGWHQSSPLLPGLGFCLGTRAQMFHVRRGHPNAPAPGKRPRTTLTPSLARLTDGRWLVFGTPGGDCQDQWTLLLFLRLVDGGLDPQAACDAANMKIAHAPNSFFPREARPGVVELEPAWGGQRLRELRERGHEASMGSPDSQGRCSVIEVRPDGGLAAAISRRQGHPEVGVLR